MPSYRVDLSGIRPFASGGVEAVAAGVTQALLQIEPSIRVSVTQNDLAGWADRLQSEPESLDPVAFGAASFSRLRKLMGPRLRKAVDNSAVAQRVLASRARRSAGESGDIVWYPFHRSPAAAAQSVVTLHDLRVFQPGLQEGRSQVVITENVEHAKALVCSWQHPYRIASSLFPDHRDKLFLIPLPVLNPGAFVVRTSPAKSPGPLKLLAPVATSPHKNQDLVIRALPLLPNAEVTFTGPTDAEQLANLQTLARELGVLSRISWRGYLSVEELDEEYARSHILVMPSRWEAASGPIFEAVSRGMPFVGTNIAPIAAQIEQFELVGPLVDPDSPQDLARAVARVERDYADYVEAQRGPAARLAARTWQDTAIEYRCVFDWASGAGEKPRALQP